MTICPPFWDSEYGNPSGGGGGEPKCENGVRWGGGVFCQGPK